MTVIYSRSPLRDHWVGNAHTITHSFYPLATTSRGLLLPLLFSSYCVCVHARVCDDDDVLCMLCVAQMNQNKMPSRAVDSRAISRGPDFTPAFADFGRQMTGGRGAAVSHTCTRTHARTHTHTHTRALKLPQSFIKPLTHTLLQFLLSVSSLHAICRCVLIDNLQLLSGGKKFNRYCASFELFHYNRWIIGCSSSSLVPDCFSRRL